MMNPRIVVTWTELPPARRRRTGLGRAGLTPREHRVFSIGMVVLVLIFASGWVVATLHAVTTGAPRPGLAAGMTTNPLSGNAPPPAAFLLDAALRGFVQRSGYAGESGQVRIVIQDPGDSLALPDAGEGVTVELIGESGDTLAGSGRLPPGVWNVLLRARNAVRRIPDFAVVSPVPIAEKQQGRIGRYLIGSWPNETGGTPRSPAYAPPRGLIRVMPENLDLTLSRHLRLRHFVTKGQVDVWPKYVLVSPRLLDKVELTIDELNRTGTRVERIGVISGFRTPSYNAGGGNTSGRGALSRHMYGDALDWFVDNDSDGRMDDLNGDGSIDADDGRVIVNAAERVGRQHPTLVGGIGLYRPTGAHSGFVHLDTRGYRARW
jgi:hypothetical protein